MAWYRVTDEELTGIADAIREINGETGGISYPAGFVQSINSIIWHPMTENEWLAGVYSGIVYDAESTEILPYSLAGIQCSKVVFPVCTVVGSSAFISADISNISLPECRSILSYAFSGVKNLVSVYLPKVSLISAGAFQKCIDLFCASFPSCSIIGAYAFESCYNLISLYLTGETVVSLANANTFMWTPISTYSSIAGRYGSIFVPASLLSSYQNDAKWSVFSERFVGVE